MRLISLVTINIGYVDRRASCIVRLLAPSMPVHAVLPRLLWRPCGRGMAGHRALDTRVPLRGRIAA